MNFTRVMSLGDSDKRFIIHKVINNGIVCASYFFIFIIILTRFETTSKDSFRSSTKKRSHHIN